MPRLRREPRRRTDASGWRAARLYLVSRRRHDRRRGGRGPGGRCGHAPAARPALADDSELLEMAAPLARSVRRATARCCGSTTAPTWHSPRGPTACTSARPTPPVAEVRRRVGDDLLIGLSTHSSGAAGGRHRRRGRPAERRAGLGDPDQAGTPGRRARLRAPRRRAAPAGAVVRDRWHRLVATSPEVVAAGAERIVVVRAVRDARRPGGCGARAFATPCSRGAPLAQRSSRKRRKERQRAARQSDAPAGSAQGRPRPPGEQRGLHGPRLRARKGARTRRRAPRSKPLAPGERPAAVTVAFWVAVVAVVANVVALVVNFDSGRGAADHLHAPGLRGCWRSWPTGSGAPATGRCLACRRCWRSRSYSRRSD